MAFSIDVAAPGIVRTIEEVIVREDNRQKAAQFAGINSREQRVCGIYCDMQTYQQTELKLVPEACFPFLKRSSSITLTTGLQVDLAKKVAELVEGNPMLKCALTLCEPRLRSLSESKVIAFFVTSIRTPRL